jgi:hypothetical protein
MKFAFTLLTIVLLVGTVFGQLSAGSLVGTVVDQNGGAVAGATVEVTDNATSKVRTVQATTDGTFTVPQHLHSQSHCAGIQGLHSHRTED